MFLSEDRWADCLVEMKRKQPAPRLKWLTPATVDRPMAGPGHLAERSADSKIYYEHLSCTPVQLAEIRSLDASGKSILLQYDPANEESQAQAQQFINEHGLSPSMMMDLESRWSIRWRTQWGQGKSTRIRLLVQCCCGYDAENRQDKESKKKQRTTLSSSTPATTHCHCPVPQSSYPE